MDSNTWLRELDTSRPDSADAAALRAVLESHGLHVVSPPGVPTHRSGTIIDVVAVSSGVCIQNLAVHNSGCQQSCRGFPGCWPALGSDHNMITFEIFKIGISGTNALQASEWKFGRVDWHRAIRGDLEGLLAWQQMLESCAGTSVPLRQMVVDSLQAALTQWLWSCAAAQGSVRRRTAVSMRRRRRWWNNACREAWQARQRAHAIWRAEPSSGNRESYRVARNAFSHQVCRARSAYWFDFAEAIGHTASSNPSRVASAVRREVARSQGRAPVCMLNEAGTAELSSASSMQGWPRHFASVNAQAQQSLDDAFASSIAMHVESYAVEAARSPGPCDGDFCSGELVAARRSLHTGSASGVDRLDHSVQTYQSGMLPCSASSTSSGLGALRRVHGAMA